MTTTLPQADPVEHATDQKRPGAPVGNKNGQKHGVRALRDGLRHGLTAYALPKGCRRIGSAVGVFRRALEDAVVAARGNVTVVDSSTINRAIRCEVKARLAARWLSREGDAMSCAERLSFLNAADAGTLGRDRAIADLSLSDQHLAGLWSLANGPDE